MFPNAPVNVWRLVEELGLELGETTKLGEETLLVIVAVNVGVEDIWKIQYNIRKLRGLKLNFS